MPLDLVGVSGPCDDWISCYRLISLLFLLQEKNHWIGSRQLDWGKNGFPYICRHFISTPSYFKQTNKIRHFPCHFKTLGTNLKSSTVNHYKGLIAKTEWICPGLRLKEMIPGPSQHGLSQTIFIKNSVCQVVIKHMPSLSWILNANKAVMICFLELADMCQHGLSQFWHVSAKLIMYIKFILGI